MKLYRFIALSFLFLWVSRVLYTTKFDGLFWDLGVYSRAVQDHLDGINPYRIDAGLAFVYHPYVLEGLTWLDGVAPLSVSFLLMYLLVTILFVSLIVQFAEGWKDKGHREGALMSFLLVVGTGMSLGAAGFSAIRTGNLTIFLHFLVLGAFLWSLGQKNRTRAIIFALTLIVSAVIKPYFLAYAILLPYVFDRVQAGIAFLLVVASTAAVWLSAILVAPELWSQLMAALSHQTLGVRDLGYSVFGVTVPYVGSKAALVSHIVIILAGCVGGAILFLRKGYHLLDARLIPFWVIVAIFANPRMKEYDFCVAAIFLFCFIYIHSTRKALQAIIVGLGISAVPIVNLIAANLGFPVSVVLMPSLQMFQLLAFVLMLPLAVTALNRQE